VLARQRLREREEPRLAGGVHGLAARAHARGVARHEDESAAALRRQLRQRGLGQPEGPAEVDVNQALPVGRPAADERAHHVDPRVRDHHVEPAQRADRLVHRGVQRCGVGHVAAGEAAAQLLRERASRVFQQVEHGDARALARETPCRRGADPARSSRDERAAACKASLLHGASSCFPDVAGRRR
jgi:hypothetical protein